MPRSIMGLIGHDTLLRARHNPRTSHSIRSRRPRDGLDFPIRRRRRHCRHTRLHRRPVVESGPVRPGRYPHAARAPAQPLRLPPGLQAALPCPAPALARSARLRLVERVTRPQWGSPSARGFHEVLGRVRVPVVLGWLLHDTPPSSTAGVCLWSARPETGYRSGRTLV